MGRQAPDLDPPTLLLLILICLQDGNGVADRVQDRRRHARLLCSKRLGSQHSVNGSQAIWEV